MQRIGIIGLGAMGRPMARHLIANGYAVCGYDPAAPAREQAAALGVSIVASPAEVARASDLVLIVVGFDDASGESVLRRAGPARRVAPRA